MAPTTAMANHTIARVVGVQATAATVEESGGSAKFQLIPGIYCAGGTVDYTITGTATDGTDYNAITASGTVTYSCGTQDLATVIPINDVLKEGSETVTVTISNFQCSALYCAIKTNANTATITIRDDDSPAVSITAPDSAASETGPDPATFQLSANQRFDVATTVNYTLSGDATSGADYTLSGGTASGSLTHTSDADFNAGDTSANTQVTYDSVALLPSSSVYSLLDETNTGAQQLLGLPVSGSVHALGSSVIAVLPGGGYRMYYADSAGSSWRIAYVDTTDTNAPNAFNLGTQTLLGIGGASASDQARPMDLESLPGGGYRLYYIYYDGTNWRIAYKDTSDTNLPDSSNMGGTQTFMGLLGSDTHDYGPFISALSGGGYRFYYSIHNGSYYRIVYQDTTDTSLPDSTNLGTLQETGIGTSTTDHAVNPYVVKKSDGSYRFYYATQTGGGAWALAYRDTTDTSLPASTGTNLGAQVLLGIGGATSDRALDFSILQMASGQYRVYYGNYDGTNWRMAYRNADGVNTYNTSGTYVSSVIDLLAAQTPTTLDYTAPPVTGTSLSVEARAGDVATPDGTWTGWQPSSAFSSLGSHRYVQYRANLSTTDTSVTPTLDDITVHYDSGAVTADASGVTFPLGSDTATVILTPVDDSADEYDETATLTVAPGSGTDYQADPYGAPLSASATIADNDLNAVTVAWTQDAAELGGVAGVFTVTRQGVLDNPLTVNYTVGGTASASDYAGLTGSVVIPAGTGVGSNSATVSFTPINDDLVENPETVVLTLSMDTAYTVNAPNNATVTIADNDGVAGGAGSFTQSDWTAAASPADGLSCTMAGGTWTSSGVCIGTHDANQSGWTYSSSVGSGLNLNLGNRIGDGSDGPYNCSTGTCTLAAGTYNFTTFTIAGGATVKVTGTTALILKVQGDVNIDGTLDLNGTTGTAGPGGSDGGAAQGAGFGVGAGSYSGCCIYTGSGAGFGGNGGTQYSALAGGSAYNDDTFSAYSFPTNAGGSGGGGGSDSVGGGGGGAVRITAGGHVTIGSSGAIEANGGASGNATHSGGGGSGGGILIESVTAITNSGVIQAAGGTAGTGTNANTRGGGGGGGRVYFNGAASTPITQGTVDVSGGIGYANGAAGSITVGNTLMPTKMSLSKTTQTWIQTDDSSTDRGFRTSGHTMSGDALLSGSGDAAYVTIAPVSAGDGADGPFDSSTYNGISIPGITGTSPNIAINTDEATHGGVYNFTDFRIAAGDTVTVTGSNPLKLYVELSADIDGTLNASGSGSTPGPGGGKGGNGQTPGTGVGPSGTGGGGAPNAGTTAGGGGGGHSAAGTDGTPATDGGIGGGAYGDSTVSTLYGGSGGGGGERTNNYRASKYGGGGGGAVMILAGVSINVTGQITANGANGQNGQSYSAFGSTPSTKVGPGGGGAGGTLKLISTTINLANGGTRLSAVGGAGGTYGTSAGGNGADGRIRLEATNLQGMANANAGSGTVTTAALSNALLSAGSGTYISGVQFMGYINGLAGAPGPWGDINWSEQVPTGTTLTVSVHSCALSDCSDRGPTDWSQAVNGQDISSLTFVDDGDAYLQYKVDMTTDGSDIPRFLDLQAAMTSYGAGVLYQTDATTTKSGFNNPGATLIGNAVVAGTGESTSVVLTGVAGTGADGVFDSSTYDGSSIAGISGSWPTITIDTDEATHGGVYNFSSFSVRQNFTVKVTGSHPFVVYSLTNAVIDGTLDASGYSGDASGNQGVPGPGGGAGGAGCTNGGGSGGGSGVPDGTKSGAGGGGFGSTGLAGNISFSETPGAGGAVYGDAAMAALDGGSGGGGGAAVAGGCIRGVYGGGGGGAIYIRSGGQISVGDFGLITVNGGQGGSKAQNAVVAGGGAGGGSGGGIKLLGNSVFLNNSSGSLTARGGPGGTSYYFGDGGAGGDGRIRIESNQITNNSYVTIGLGTLSTATPVPASSVSGTYISQVFDAGDTVNWKDINWSDIVPTGASLIVSVRSCSMADCSDRGSGDWSVATKNQDISSLNFVDDGQQYLQYKVEMTSDGSTVPAFEDITVNMQYIGQGTTYVSSPFDTKDINNEITGLTWTASVPTGTSLGVQLRTSSDGVTWGPWYGPASTSDYYTVSGTAINPIHSDGSGDRYFQYRAQFTATDAGATPTLDDLSVSYDAFGGAAAVSHGDAFGNGSTGPASNGGSSGGGVVAWYFFVLLLIKLSIQAARGDNANGARTVHTPSNFRHKPFISNKTQLVVAFAAIMALIPRSSDAGNVIDWNTGTPETGTTSGDYKYYAVGSITGDFYQEFYIRQDSAFGTFPGGPSSASAGLGNGGNNVDPLSSNQGVSGDATGNPNRVIIWQKMKDGEILTDFLKDDYTKKPRIIQTVTTSKMTSEFEMDMRNLSYSDASTPAQIIHNRLTINDSPAGTWDISNPNDVNDSVVTGGKYTYTSGSGPGGSAGTYAYSDGTFNESPQWSDFWDPTTSNPWSTSTNKP